MHRSAPCRSLLALAALAPLLLAPALALGAVARAETPKIYKWVDSNGIAHYTTDPERIPKALRNRIQSTRTAAERAPAAAPAPQANSPVPTEPMTAPEASPAIPEAIAAVPEAAPEAIAAVPEAAPEAIAAVPEAAPEAIAAVPEAASAAGPEAPPSAAGVEPATPTPAPTTSVAVDDRGWFDRDALPRLNEGRLPNGEPSPGQLAALAAEQQALDSRIAEVQAEIARDENFLKGLISDPDLDADIPLFDRPDFLEVSKRLPELQAQLQELRDERAKLETP